jgi:glutathione synthase/RimK-type ligase-like ATP-grasp enzyme
MLIRRFTHLVQVYHDLGPQDLFVGQIPSSFLKAAMLTDLAARGVGLLPSASAQVLNSSKTAQAFVLGPWMAPHTQVISRRKELLDAMGYLRQRQIDCVVTKHDHLHCGHGVRKWDHLETLYNCMSLDERHFPFVMQPFQAVEIDLRVILVGDYTEAYARYNPAGFRMNLAAGGHSCPHELTAEQVEICRRIMDRAQMPYAHIDLLITREGNLYLSEISLNGGLRGAQVDRGRLERMKRAHLEALAQIHQSGQMPS